MHVFHQLMVFLSIFLVISGWSCRKDFEYDPFVRTEDLLYVSGEQVILTGRILASGAVRVSDHGFHISEDESFTEIQKISLGQREVPGRFIGQYELLKNATGYFIRSYAEINGRLLEGNVLTFQTLVPTLNTFSPVFGFEDHIITLTGSNLGANSKVYFGENEAQIDEILYESIIKVRVPPIGKMSRVEVKIESQNSQLSYPDSFEYIIGSWTKLREFSHAGFSLAETFQMESDQEVIFGLGTPLLGQLLNHQIWSVDKMTRKISEIEFHGSALLHPFSAWPYFGSGSLERVKQLGTTPLDLSTDFWKYDQGAFIRLSDLPFALYKAVAFQVNGNLYVFGGQNTSRRHENRIYKYLPLTDDWELISSSPFNIDADLPHFTYGKNAFFIDSNSLIHQFDLEQLSWSVAGEYPVTIGREGIATVIGDLVYLGLYRNRSDVWAWNITENKWIQKRGLAGDFRNINLTHWQTDQKIYVLRDKQLSELNSDHNILIEFDPNDF